MKGRDEELFDALTRARYPELLRFGRVLAGSTEGGADLVQGALERTLRSWSRLQAKHDPEGYIRRIMVNRSLSLRRRSWREQVVESVPDRPDGIPDSDRQVWVLLGELPARQRAVIALRFLDDLSVAEVASILGISEGTVKSQTAKAKAHLRAALSALIEEGVDDGSSGR